MEACSICGPKLFGEQIQVCSSILPHSNILYSDKAAELLEDKFGTIVKLTDHLCKKCTSLLKYIDTLENDLMIAKNEFFSSYKKKNYRELPDQPVSFQTLDLHTINGHFKTVDKKVIRTNVYSGLIEANRGNIPAQISTEHGSTIKVKLYSCRKCTYKSTEFEDVRLHIVTSHKKNNEDKVNQTPAQNVPVHNDNIKRRLHACWACDYKSTEFEDVRLHIMTSHKKKNEDKVNQTPAQNPLQIPIKPTGLKIKIFKCMFCTYQSTNHEYTRSHVEGHMSSLHVKTHLADSEDKEIRIIRTSVTCKVSEEFKLKQKEEEEEEIQAETMAKHHDKGTQVDTDMLLNVNLSTRTTDEQEECENGTQEDPMNSQEEPMDVNNETDADEK